MTFFIVFLFKINVLDVPSSCGGFVTTCFSCCLVSKIEIERSHRIIEASLSIII